MCGCHIFDMLMEGFYLDWFEDLQSVWERIKDIEKPILLYGMGDGAVKILNIFAEKNIKIDGIFASDEFVRGQSFMGYKVRSYADCVEKFGDFAIILAFGTSIPELMERIVDFSKKHELLVPDVPLFGGGLFDDDYIEKNTEKIKTVYSLMADDISKTVFKSVLRYKYTGDINYLLSCETPRQEVFENIIKFGLDEVYLDLGAYDGDTVEEAVGLMNGKYDRIIAVEPAEKNFEKLMNKVASYKDIECMNIGIYSKKAVLNFSGKSGRNAAISEDGNRTVKVDSIDGIMGGERVSYIKMDIEGAERDGLLGGAGIIKKYMPSLAISAYHRIDDMIELPLLIHDLCGDYKIHLRHHPYIPAWETNIYAVI